MSISTHALIAAYLVLATLLVALNFHTRWSRAVKLAMTLVVGAFFWITYTAWPGLLGWPTEEDLPTRFYLHAVQIEEPHRIYLWGSDIDAGFGQTVPRSFAVPYSAKLHDRIDKATRTLRKGLPVIGQVATVPAAQREQSTLEQVNAVDVDIVFIDAPQGLIPGKN